MPHDQGERWFHLPATPQKKVFIRRQSHNHVLPFYSIDTAAFQLALVYGWVGSDNITRGLDLHPGSLVLAWGRHHYCSLKVEPNPAFRS